MKDIRILLKNLNIKYKDLSYFELALTHSSYNGDANTKHKDYERLEFMGDAVLGFVVAELIFKHYQNMDQGTMSKLRSSLVKSSSLAEYGRKLCLYDYILAGHSVDHSQIKNSDKILEDVFEALIGAIYIDQGIKAAINFVTSIFIEDINIFDIDSLTDYKTRLQEEMQSDHRDSVTYRLVKKMGPAHNPVFVSEVLFHNEVLGKGLGKTIKASEQDAAKQALKKKAV